MHACERACVCSLQESNLPWAIARQVQQRLRRRPPGQEPGARGDRCDVSRPFGLVVHGVAAWQNHKSDRTRENGDKVDAPVPCRDLRARASALCVLIGELVHSGRRQLVNGQQLPQFGGVDRHQFSS